MGNHHLERHKTRRSHLRRRYSNQHREQRSKSLQPQATMSGHPPLHRYLPRHLTVSGKYKNNRNGITTRHLRKPYHNACHQHPLRTRTSAKRLTMRSINRLLKPRPYLRARAASLRPMDGGNTPKSVRRSSRSRPLEADPCQRVHRRREQHFHHPLTRYAGCAMP